MLRGDDKPSIQNEAILTHNKLQGQDSELADAGDDQTLSVRETSPGGVAGGMGGILERFTGR